MTILSRKPLSNTEYKKVEDILRESNCPFESLKNTFKNFSGLIGNVVVFDDLTFDEIKRFDYAERSLDDAENFY